MSGFVPVADGLFEVAADGAITLIGGRCDACARPHFPLGPSCPLCGHALVHPTPLSRTGTLWGWTTVHTPPPGYAGDVPFDFGVVELPEGLRLITRLERTAGADEYAFAQPMALTTTVVASATPAGDDADTGEARVTWCFVPAGTER